MYIAIWNSIENDFVLSTACLPAVPPVLRLCKSIFRRKMGHSGPPATPSEHPDNTSDNELLIMNEHGQGNKQVSCTHP